MINQDDYGDYEDECPVCGSSQWWEMCPECGGDGYIEVYESDPMWYDEDDVERCDLCEGNGGWYICTNQKNHAEVSA